MTDGVLQEVPTWHVCWQTIIRGECHADNPTPSLLLLRDIDPQRAALQSTGKNGIIRIGYVFSGREVSYA